MGKKPEKQVGFVDWYQGRKSAVVSVMNRYAQAGVVLVPELAAAGTQFDAAEFVEEARLSGWNEERVTIRNVEMIGYVHERD